MASINIERTEELVSYLKGQGVLGELEMPTCSKLSGGVSCRTMLVSRQNAVPVVVKQALNKLRVEEDWFSEPERIIVEARALQFLPEILPPDSTPQLMRLDEQHSIVVMEAVPQPHKNWKSLLLEGQVQPSHVDQFARILGQLHSQTYGNENYANLFSERKFFRGLRLDAYFKFTSTQVPEARQFLVKLINENLNTNVCLVHGDFSPKNVLVFEEKLVLLDFEVMHYGDGAFDLGFAMTHFLSKANHLDSCRNKFIASANQFWERYKDIALPDAPMERRAVNNTIGCLLARVKGKSPLEYLSIKEQDHQLASCLNILNCIPPTMPELIGLWETELNERDQRN